MFPHNIPDFSLRPLSVIFLMWLLFQSWNPSVTEVQAFHVPNSSTDTFVGTCHSGNAQREEFLSVSAEPDQGMGTQMLAKSAGHILRIREEHEVK